MLVVDTFRRRKNVYSEFTKRKAQKSRGSVEVKKALDRWLRFDYRYETNESRKARPSHETRVLWKLQSVVMKHKIWWKPVCIKRATLTTTTSELIVMSDEVIAYLYALQSSAFWGSHSADAVESQLFWDRLRRLGLYTVMLSIGSDWYRYSISRDVKSRV